jgi:hypothetical protein
MLSLTRSPAPPPRAAPPIPIAELCAVGGLDKYGRAGPAGAIEINRGANAAIFSFALGSGSALLATGETVPLSDIVVKVGRWRTQTAFDDEARLQRVSADAGCAPPVFYSTAQPIGDGSTAVKGSLAMLRLTEPTLWRWMHWLTFQHRQAQGSANLAWTIDKAALKLPIFKAWEVGAPGSRPPPRRACHVPPPCPARRGPP